MLCCRNAQADAPDLKDHLAACECARCRTRQQAGKLAWVVSHAMMAAAEARNDALADKLCDVLLHLNRARGTGVYPQT